MELGLTWPLQGFVKQRVPPCGTEADRMFCWDLHVIQLRGRESLLAVHCHSRYAFVRFDLSPWEWADLSGTFAAGLEESLAAAGISQEAAECYVARAGTPLLTRTHGRREVAFLNRAWEDVLALDFCLDPASTAQPLLDHAVNSKPSRCAAFPDLAPAVDRFRESLNREAGLV